MFKDQWTDPRWQKKRLEIMNRDKWMCRVCKENKEMLSVHHIHYGLKEDHIGPWDYSNGTLLTVCESCHEVLHKYPYYMKCCHDYLDVALEYDLLNGDIFLDLYSRWADMNYGSNILYGAWGPLI